MDKQIKEKSNVQNDNLGEYYKTIMNAYKIKKDELKELNTFEFYKGTRNYSTNIYYVEYDHYEYRPLVDNIKMKYLKIYETEYDNLHACFKTETNKEIAMYILKAINDLEDIYKDLEIRDSEVKDGFEDDELIIWPKNILCRFGDAFDMVYEFKNNDNLKVVIEEIIKNKECRYGLGIHSISLRNDDEIEIKYTLYIDVPNSGILNYKDEQTIFQGFFNLFDAYDNIARLKMKKRGVNIFPFIGISLYEDDDERLNKICKLFRIKQDRIKKFFEKGDEDDKFELTFENFQKTKLYME